MNYLSPNQVGVPIDAVGISGRYRFQLDPIGTSYKDIPGVYMFCKLASNGKWDVVYVGETDSLWRRLTNELKAHHSIRSAISHGATHICTLHVPGDRSRRLYIETDLRNALRPPCNKQ